MGDTGASTADGLAAVRFLSEHVAKRLLGELTSNAMKPGDRLPSERILAGRYAVSRVTMRAALHSLESTGVITAAPSRGWFVNRPQTQRSSRPEGMSWRSTSPQGRIPGFTEQAEERGLAVRSRVLRHQVRAADVTEADQLRMAPGGDLIDLLRVRYLDDVATVVEHNRLPLAICSALATTDFTTQSLYQTLATSTPPHIPMDAEYSVEARIATTDEAVLLELTEAIPVLVAQTLTRNIDGRPIELTSSAYRGDRYRYRAHIVAQLPRQGSPVEPLAARHHL